MARTPEQQAAMDAARAAKTARAAKPAATMGSVGPAGAVPGAYVPPVATGPAGPVSAYEAPGAASSMPTHPMQGARAAPPVAPVAPAAPAAPAPAPSTFYGTANGVATDRGAAEAVRRVTPVGPQLPGGMAPNTGPQLPGGMATNTGPQLPGGMAPNTGPKPPGGMTPNTGPQLPGGMAPNTGPQPQGFAHAMRTAAARMNEVNARQSAAIRAPIDAATQGLRSFGVGVKNVAGAVGEYGGAVLNNPLTKYVVAPAAGLVGGVINFSDARAAAAQGDNLTAADKTVSGIANAALTTPYTAPVGAAYLGGQLIGSGIDAGLQRFAPGFREKIGGLFASDADRAKVAKAEAFARSGVHPEQSVRPGQEQGARAPAAPAGPFPQASYSNEGNNYRTPEAVQSLRPPPFDPTGKIIKTVGKDGKVSYSGDNVTGADKNIYSPDGRVVNGGDPKNPEGFGVTSIDTSEGHRQNLLELQRLQGERAEREAGFAGNQPGGGLGGISGTTMSSSLRDTAESGRGTTMSDLIAQKRALKQDTINAQREGNAMQAATMRANNQATVEAQRYSADLGARTARENNQMQRESNQIQREIAMGQRQYQRDKDRIELGMKEREFQTGVEKTNFEQKGAREKALQAKIEQRFTSNHPLTGNPQVDANQVRVFRENMDRAVARLGADGVHKLSPKDEEKLFAAAGLLQKVQANASNINPLKPDLLRTVDALDLTNLQQDPKTGDFHIHSPDNPKVHGQVIPKRILNTEEAHFFTLGGLRGTPTNRNDILVNGARQ